VTGTSNGEDGAVVSLQTERADEWKRLEDEEIVKVPLSIRREDGEKAEGPKFPLKFKLKMPGQELASHFKFLQSWSVHKKYYERAEAD